MKPVVELEGDELDYWVAIGLGYKMERARDLQMRRGEKRILLGPQPFQQRFAFQPSRDMNQAMLIAVEKRIGVVPYEDDKWVACEPLSECQASGNTVMIALMRTFVLMHFGNLVPNDFERISREL